jgi:hypothetical protein
MRRDITGRAIIGVNATIEKLKARMSERLDVGAGKVAMTPKELSRAVTKMSPDQSEMFVNKYPGGINKYLEDTDA